MLQTKRRPLTQQGFAFTVVILAVVVVAILGVGATVAVRQTKHHNQANETAQEVAAGNKAQEQPSKATEKTEATPAPPPATTTQSQPAGTAQTTTPKPASQPAPKPAQITHPTQSSCLPNDGNFTIYASVQGGTTVYKQNYRDSALYAKTVAYGTSLSVRCYGGEWLEYHEGEQPLYVNVSDVSVTKP